jgi:hypothetical protein
MSEYDESREQWLRDCESFFRSVQSYNSTAITIGYGTFFGLLLFLQGKVNARLLYVAALCMVISGSLFVGFELFQNVKLALQAQKAGKLSNQLFRFWAAFFIPALLFALCGVGTLVYLFLCNLSHQPSTSQPPGINSSVPK